MADELNLMPGAWRVTVVQTTEQFYWVIGDSIDEAKRLGEKQALERGASSAVALDARPPTIQEAGGWFESFARARMQNR